MAYPWTANDILTAADLNAAIGTGIVSTGLGAWTSYTPTFTQTATITKTIGRAAYIKIGRLVIADVTMTATSAGTAAAQIRVGLPVTAAAGTPSSCSAYFYDTSATTRYCLSGFAITTSALAFVHDTGGSGVFGSSPGVTVASGDIVGYTVMYESAS